MRLATFRNVLLALASLSLLPSCSKDVVCSADRSACGSACVALQVDPAHCGTCGHACTAGQTCDQGACVFATVTDCGAAGRACAAGERCQDGRCVADLYLACFNTHEVREARVVETDGLRSLAPAGLPLAVARGPIGLAALGGDLYVASAAPGGAETLTRIAREPPAVRAARLWSSAVPTPDLQFLAAHGEYLYVSHSSLGTLLVVSPAGDVVEEHAFETTSPNPLGIAFDGDVAYVALQARNEVAVLDVSAVGTCASAGACIREVKRIDVSGLADAGARAMPSRIAVFGRRAFVTLWNLDPSWNPPEGSHGRVAVIDLDRGAIDAAVQPDGVLDLGPDCLNPAELAVDAAGGPTLYVSCGAFDYSDWPDVKTYAHGIARVDLSEATPEVKQPMLPAPEGSAPGDLAFCGGTGYVADRNSGRVFFLDPEAGAVGGTELCPRSEGGMAYVADIACGD